MMLDGHKASTHAAHERLHAIAGRWKTSGHVVGDPPVPVDGTDSYEVFAGGQFLVHHVDVTVGQQPVHAIEIIGEPDADGIGYLARSFDSDGHTEVMRVTIDPGGVFHFIGGPDVAQAAQPTDGRTARVRSRLAVAHDRASMRAIWERSEDGTHWEPWMQIEFLRVS